MNQSDKYYLKKGKLELSMLDEEEADYVAMPRRNSGQKGIELEHRKGFSKVSRTEQQKPQQTLKVSKEIYNTLHTMGQFLTKIEPQASSMPAKKDCLDSLSISKADQIKEINEAVTMPLIKRKPIDRAKGLSDTRRIDVAELKKMAIGLEYRSQELNEASKKERDIEAQIEASYKEASQMMLSNNEVAVCMEEYLNMKPKGLDESLNKLDDLSDKDHMLNQNNIDNILDSFFGNKESQYIFSKELKDHIEKHIVAIKNYE